eukprot:scaffold10349_cov67-Phaeocystis_antarctica.AAC.3
MEADLAEKAAFCRRQAVASTFGQLSDPSFLPKLEAVCGSRRRRLSHGRRPPGGRPRTVAGRSQPRPQAAARQAAGAAARSGSGQQGGPRGADGAEGGDAGERGHGGCRRTAARCRRGLRAFEPGVEPRLLWLR